MWADEIMAAINPNMRLTKNFFRDIYAVGINDPSFPDRAIKALEGAGCSRAQKYYDDWVTQYETEREAMLNRVAHWYAEQCRREAKERERKAKKNIIGSGRARYQFTGFPEDW